MKKFELLTLEEKSTCAKIGYEILKQEKLNQIKKERHTIFDKLDIPLEAHL